MKIKNLILLLGTMVGLVACGTGEDSTSLSVADSTSIPNSTSVADSTSLVEPTLITSWSEDLKEAFIEHLSEEIPVAPMYSGTVDFLVNEEEDDNYIWIVGEGATTFNVDYDVILKAAGYDFLYEDDMEYLVYEKELTGIFINYSIFLRFGYADNGEAEIFAFAGYSVTFKVIENWDAEIIEAMQELFGMELPVFPFFGNFYEVIELADEEDSEVYGLKVYGYSASGDEYVSNLLDAGFIEHGTLPNGFIIFEKILGEGVSVFVDVYYEEVYINEYVSDIYFYLANTSKGRTTAWETDMVQGLRDFIADGSDFDIPFIELSGFYTYEVFSNEFGNYIEIHDMLSPNLTEEYISLLLDAGFELDENFLGSGISVHTYKTDGKIIAASIGYDSNGFHIIIQIYDDVFTWNSDWFIGFDIDVTIFLPTIPFTVADAMMIDVNLATISGIWVENGLMMFSMFASMYGYIYSEDMGAMIFTLDIPDVGIIEIMIADVVIYAMMQITFTPAS